eukprot:g66074.t1
MWKQVDEQYEACKISLRTQMIETLLRKKRRLSSNWNDDGEGARLIRSARTRGRGAGKKSQAARSKGPGRWALSSEEIQDDLTAIKKDIVQMEKVTGSLGAGHRDGRDGK